MKIKTTSGQLVFIEWFKFKIAYLLDRNPNLCWAEIAMWAMGYKSFWETFRPIDGEARSLMCPYSGPYAYCGKCEINGKMPKKWCINSFKGRKIKER